MMNDDIIARFAAIVGEAHALRDPADIAPYVEERRKLWPGTTPLVLRPGNRDEVREIMLLASETGTPVVPQGGNTGLVGGQVPDRSGAQIVLSLSRLNRIREIDTHSNTATVEAGVILQTLREEAERADRLFPLSLGAQGSCQIGGNLSSNAGGTGALAYGVARDLCLGIEVVMPTGEVFEDLRKLKKDNTGYDLKDLFIGAEGTLGVITAAVLKLFPRPKGRQVAWVGLESPQKALDLFVRATGRAGPSLTGFELMGDMVVDFAVRHIGNTRRPLAGHHDWHVLLEISSGRSEEDARTLAEEILGEGMEAGLIEDAVLSQNMAQANAFWFLREEMSEAQQPEGFSIKHDISVPVQSIPRFVELASKAVAEISPGARIVCMGHMGDGNLHFNVLEPKGGDPEYPKLYRTMNDAVHAIVRDMGGSFSAEHGIGQMKRAELAATEPPVAIELMRRVKAAFDPAGIMNPGKML
jgi:FAD/FMN-containing dehydrogenase